MRTLRPLSLLLCLALAGVVAPAASADAAVAQGTYHPVTSSRLLDTRSGLGAPKQPLGPGATLQLAVTGRGGVPASGAAAAVINITVQSPTASSFLTAYPSGQTRPATSSINYQVGGTRANIATVLLGDGGKIAIYNNSGSTSVIVDVVGFYASAATTTEGNEFAAVTPNRLFDTRNDAEGALAGKSILTTYIDFGTGGDQNSSVRALAVNVTAVGAEGSGYLSTWDGNGSPPATSTLNFADSGAVANMAVVKTALCSDCGTPAPVQFGVYNGSADTVHVFVDLVGVYYNDGTVGLRFSPLTPVRISDSRKPLNGTPLAAGQTQQLTAPSSVADSSTVALVTNVAAVQPTSTTFLTLWKGGEARPPVSNLNARAGSTVANGAVIELSSTNKFNIYNNAGTTNFLIDVTGRFRGPSTSSAQQQTSKVSGFRTLNATSERRTDNSSR